MSDRVRPVKGMKDLHGNAYNIFHTIIGQLETIVKMYGYAGCQTPILEYSEIFAHNLGETSDIVNKERYCFDDRGGSNMTMRPEFTIPVVRSIISAGLHQNLPIRTYSYGPLFRYERPQKGRLRQFHQFNIEHFGAKSYADDVEIIVMAYTCLKALNIHDKVVLNINSLGDQESRNNYRNLLVEYFNDHVADLSEDSKVRLEKNPLRILDSKDDGDKKLLNNAPKMRDCYNDISKEHYAKLKSCLILCKLTILKILT